MNNSWLQPAPHPHESRSKATAHTAESAGPAGDPQLTRVGWASEPRDSPEVSVIAAAPSALGTGRHGLETHAPFRMMVRPASSFSSLQAWMRSGAR